MLRFWKGFLRNEASQRKHKVQNLVRMEELLEGFSRAVRFIVNEYSHGKITGRDGGKITLYGPLSQLISTDEKYSVALETAFGQSLQNIVAKDEYSAKAAIEYLKKKNAGRATFYPMDTMKGTEADAATLGLSRGEGFIAVASTLVKCEDNLRGIEEHRRQNNHRRQYGQRRENGTKACLSLQDSDIGWAGHKCRRQLHGRFFGDGKSASFPPLADRQAE